MKLRNEDMTNMKNMKNEERTHNKYRSLTRYSIIENDRYRTSGYVPWLGAVVRCRVGIRKYLLSFAKEVKDRVQVRMIILEIRESRCPIVSPMGLGSHIAYVGDFTRCQSSLRGGRMSEVDYHSTTVLIVIYTYESHFGKVQHEFLLVVEPRCNYGRVTKLAAGSVGLLDYADSCWYTF